MTYGSPPDLRRVYQLVKERPDLFAERVLGLQLWDQQRRMLDNVRRFSRSATSSGHKIGKSATIAAAALWIVTTVPGARVILTSASGRQVKGVIWRDLKKWYRRASDHGMHLGGKLSDSPDTGLRFNDGREIVGFSTDAAEKIAGFSGGRLYFFADEASGIEDPIFEAIEGNRAGGAALHQWSNPTQTTGFFFDTFHSKREHYDSDALIVVSSEDAARAVAEGRAPSGVGLATAEWCEEKLREWGEGSPIHDVRVRGRFPKESAFSVIGLGAMDASQRRWRDRFELDDETGKPTGVLDPPLERGCLHVGLDPCRFGDDEAGLAFRRGSRILRMIDTVRTMDGRQLAQWTIAKIAEVESFDDAQTIVKVDVNGIGASAFDFLTAFAADNRPNWQIIPVNSGSRVPEEYADADRYLNLRAFMHFAVREWLKSGGELPPDPKLEAEALAPRFKYSISGNRLQVEGKDDIKKRLKRSPDRFDAVCLAVYSPPVDYTAEVMDGDTPRDLELDDDPRIGRFGRTT